MTEHGENEAHQLLGLEEVKSPKNDRTRTISVPETLCTILKGHRAQQAKDRLALGAAYRDEGFVFAHADGSPVDPWNFGRAVIDCIKRAKITPITLHGLRDTHASLCAKPGVPLEVVSQRLGHASIGITAERYYTFIQTGMRTRPEPSRGGRLGNQRAPLHFCCTEPQASRKTHIG